jgi:UDP-N-acetylmuramyl pentapeptide phosphotransferase/UDP-N-acetylglucosamine-1-phosphate transferase
MDGLDWMTVAEIVPVTVTLGAFGLLGLLPAAPTLIAIALGGAMVGFAFFNRPVAKLFLGDVGSLPIGLLVGWCLLQLAGSGHLIAAALLPLYYLADATITLLRRLVKGEAVWIAHRTHFYQRATDNGFSVLQVVTEVFVLNVVLAALAALTLLTTSPYTAPLALAAGIGCVALVLNRFSRRRA